jgi:hypothetical protein
MERRKGSDPDTRQTPVATKDDVDTVRKWCLEQRRPSSNATAERDSVTDDGIVVQVFPKSAERRITPLAPTATKAPRLSEMMPFR